MEQIVKTIRTNRPQKQPKFRLDELPKVIQTDRQPKSLIADDKEKQRKRAGIAQMGINPNNKPKIIEDGRKIK